MRSEAHNCSCHWVDYWIHTGHLFINGHKMSKSLKNYITIQSYLSGRWSASDSPSETPSSSSNSPNPLYEDSPTAAADLRMFFLLHKYSSPLYFSDKTMKEAVNFRKKLQSFLQSSHPSNLLIQIRQLRSTSQTGSIVLMKRMSPESRELLTQLLSAEEEVKSALGDDFNTPLALSHLLKLTSLTGSYLMTYPLQNPEKYSIDPIPSVREYLIKMLEIFGLVIQETPLPQVAILNFLCF
jgi:cysteinyl-tRNA synthetase